MKLYCEMLFKYMYVLFFLAFNQKQETMQTSLY